MSLHSVYPKIHQRFFAYLFDLNFGLVPWFLLLFIIYITVAVILIREYKTSLLVLGHIIVTLAFSYNHHINSGMSGISRYSVWSAPIMIFIAVIGSEKIQIKKFLRIRTPLIIASVTMTCMLMYSVGIPLHRNVFQNNMLPHARFVLDRAPVLYNPLYSTFISRVNNIDGGYYYSNPVIYFDSRPAHEPYIRKILVNSQDMHTITDRLIFHDEKSRVYFENRIQHLMKQNRLFSYINIPPRYNITLISVK